MPFSDLASDLRRAGVHSTDHSPGGCEKTLAGRNHLSTGTEHRGAPKLERNASRLCLSPSGKRGLPRPERGLFPGSLRPVISLAWRIVWWGLTQGKQVCASEEPLAGLPPGLRWAVCPTPSLPASCWAVGYSRSPGPRAHMAPPPPGARAGVREPAARGPRGQGGVVKTDINKINSKSWASDYEAASAP